MTMVMKTHTKNGNGCENTLEMTVALKTHTKNDNGCENTH